jgi:hypothetical protein
VSPRRTAQAQGQSGRTAIAIVAVALVAIGLTMLARAKPAPTLLDPSSGSRSGARGLVLLLRSQGAEVEVATALSPSEQGRVVVLVDSLNENQRDDLDEWIDGGGFALIADPASPFLGSPALDTETAANGEPSEDEDEEITFNPNAIDQWSVEPGICTIGALNKLDEVSFEADRRPLPPEVPDAASNAVYLPGDGGSGKSCFGPSAARSFVVAGSYGQGTLVGLGENYIFSNDLLTSGDNAALATALLAPTSSSGRVVVLRGTGLPPAVEFGGDKTLMDLIRPGIWMAMLTALIGFVIFSLSRAWRVGRPVAEPLPSSLAGSELAVATGNLMQRAGHSDSAARLLTYRFHRDLCAAHMVLPTASVDELDRVVSSRSTVAPGSVAAVLTGQSISSDAALAQLAAEITRLRSLTLADLGGARFVPSAATAANDPNLSTQETR